MSILKHTIIPINRKKLLLTLKVIQRHMANTYKHSIKVKVFGDKEEEVLIRPVFMKWEVLPQVY